MERVAKLSCAALAGLTAASFLVGFALLPSAQADYSAQGFWSAICRAAGVPNRWLAGDAPAKARIATRVVLAPGMARMNEDSAIGRGATLALNCTMCHGALGMSRSDAPNLAGQYPEVVMKQLMDYRDGKRSSAIMEELARGLGERDIGDLSAYYASLPKARTAPTTYDESLPALVRVGDPMRNIAPCIACHGGVDQKLGAPWLEGMPKTYLVQQLLAFRSGARANDQHQLMRNMARPMTDREVAEVADFYARKAPAALAGHAGQH
jgi:cytochrome c553